MRDSLGTFTERIFILNNQNNEDADGYMEG